MRHKFIILYGFPQLYKLSEASGLGGKFFVSYVCIVSNVVVYGFCCLIVLHVGQNVSGSKPLARKINSFMVRLFVWIAVAEVPIIPAT